MQLERLSPVKAFAATLGTVVLASSTVSAINNVSEPESQVAQILTQRVSETINQVSGITYWLMGVAALAEHERTGKTVAVVTPAP